MKTKRIENTCLVRLDPNDEIITALTKLCHAQQIKGALIQGIGACESATISIYEPKTQTFKETKLSGMLDIISLQGNITRDINNKPKIHLHICFSHLDEQGKPAISAGHLQSATISYTGELFLHIVNEGISTCLDPNLNIEIWDI